MRRRLAVAFGWMILAVLSVVAVVLWASPVNGAAYLLGYGEPVKVRVTEGSVGGQYSRHAHTGEGYYLRDGKRMPVRVYDASTGDVVDGRLPLIRVGVGVGPVVYTDRSQAVKNVTIGLFGACFMSLFPGIGSLAVLRRRRTRAAVAG